MWDRTGKRSLATSIGLMAMALAAPAAAQDADYEENLYEQTGLYLTGMATYAIPAEKGDLEGETNRRLNGIFGPGTNIPEAVAEDFARYCALNPKPCPLIERMPAGEAHPRCAPAADRAWLREHIPGVFLGPGRR